MGNDDDQPLVLRSDEDHVATLTLNRPPPATLSEAMLTALAERLAEIDGDDEVHVVILAGAGRPSRPDTTCGRSGPTTTPPFMSGCSPAAPT